MKTFVARGIRFGLRAGRSPSMWPASVFMPWTRRAFDRSFNEYLGGKRKPPRARSKQRRDSEATT